MDKTCIFSIVFNINSNDLKINITGIKINEIIFKNIFPVIKDLWKYVTLILVCLTEENLGIILIGLAHTI